MRPTSRRNLRPALRRRPVLGLLLVVSLLAAAAGVYLHTTNTRAAFCLREAREALTRSDFGRARAQLLLCLQGRPRQAAVHLLAAQTARRGAEVSAERAGWYDEAEQHLRECERLDGRSEAIDLERELLRAQRGDLADVEGLLWSRVQTDDPDTPLILEALVQGYQKTYRLAAALRSATKLLELWPEDIRARFWRAQLSEQLCYLQQARDDYRKVVELDPEYDEARLRLAETLLRLHDLKEAEGHLEYLRPRRPEEAGVLLGLARCRHEAGDLAKARRLLEAVLAVQPNHPAALAERGKLALEAGQLAEAERDLRSAMAVPPPDTEAFYNLCQCLQQRGKVEEARLCTEQFQRAEYDRERLTEVLRKMVHAPSDLSLRYEAGRLLLRRGEDQEALRWLGSVLQHAPLHPGAHQALANYYERFDRQDLASRHRRLALQGAARLLAGAIH